MTADLSRLSEGERRVLLLLAEGHTAKSIAAETGLSVHAVNERLREARGKTGLGSSRELARMLREEGGPGGQEIWDKQIGVPRSGEHMHDISPDVPIGSGRHRGVIAMSLVALLMAGAALLAAAHGGHASTADTPPRVVSTYPAEGARLAPGPFTLTVTFDQRMRGDSYSFTGDPRAVPACSVTPRLSADRRTFLVDCRAEAGRSYVIGFNGGPFRNFVSESAAVSAEPSQLRFSVHR